MYYYILFFFVTVLVTGCDIVKEKTKFIHENFVASMIEEDGNGSSSEETRAESVTSAECCSCPWWRRLISLCCGCCTSASPILSEDEGIPLAGVPPLSPASAEDEGIPLAGVSPLSPASVFLRPKLGRLRMEQTRISLFGECVECWRDSAHQQFMKKSIRRYQVLDTFTVEMYGFRQVTLERASLLLWVLEIQDVIPSMENAQRICLLRLSEDGTMVYSSSFAHQLSQLVEVVNGKLELCPGISVDVFFAYKDSAHCPFCFYFLTWLNEGAER